MTKTTESKWRALIAEQERSGLTVRAFAESKGITPTTMYWWRSRLGQGRASSDLVPVEVVEHDIVVDSSSNARTGFEVRLRSGVALRVPTGFDEGELQRLVRALRC